MRLTNRPLRHELLIVYVLPLSQELPMTHAIELHNIVKTYTRGKQKVEVLHGLDLEVATGEFVALMGPSGSGKTTLLNLIAGLDSPTKGELKVAGERIDKLSGGALAKWRARNIGFIFQFYNLLPVLTAERNVEVPLLLTKLSSAQRKKNVAAALQLVGLADRAKHKPNELSGGQQQRVSIARAIVADPTILVCDEPTGDLDRENAEEILALLQTLNRSHGKTIVMVTHDPLAANHATRQIHMDKGRLVDASASIVA
jgi:putative ABC transport system ATP-binding protein